MSDNLKVLLKDFEIIENASLEFIPRTKSYCRSI